MKPAKRKLLVTCALPYANGPLHLGNMVEFIQTDIWVRWQKMMGHDVTFVCGDDAHGTPIMLNAERQGITPEELISGMKALHEADLKGFTIGLDNFHTTHSEENRELVTAFYQRLKESGDIVKRTIEQAYDPEKKMFLPDRFVKGTCPRCKAEDQYGDNCEVCGATYSPAELIEPHSTLSGATPIKKNSEHFFFDLPNYTDTLRDWVHSGRLQTQVANKLDEWLQHDLQQWDISRDAPYFGFEIPDAPGKYFYVWLDAPIGYLGSLKDLCKRRKDLDFEAIWKIDSDYEVHHFIGKDIIYFHALFWPAMLTSAGYRTPTTVKVHGYLTVNGEKMSKSRGTFVLANTYLKHLPPNHFRYYLAAKLSNGVEDIDLNFEDFRQRVNSDLVGKVVNIASRCAKFINKNFDDSLSADCCDAELWDHCVAAGDEIAELYEQCKFSHAVRAIAALADKANQFIDAHKPWQLIKEADKAEQVHAVCSLGLNLFRLLIIYLKPVLPELSEKVEDFFAVEPFTWADSQHYLANHRIKTFKPLLQRVEEKQIEAMMNDINETQTATTAPAAKPEKEDNTIEFSDFAKVDLRVAKIVNAEYVEGADKLLKLTVDVGDQTRQIFAGIKRAFAPEDLIGKHTVVVANLAPRKMRFGVSEAMMLVAVDPDGEGLWLLQPGEGVKAGMKVK